LTPIFFNRDEEVDLTNEASNAKCIVHFEPGNFEVVVNKGSTLLEAAMQAGVRLIAACGGSGTCGTCKVIVEQGQVEISRTAKLSDEEFRRGIRQACQSRVMTDARVHVPVESRLETAVLSRERKATAAAWGDGALASGWRFSPPLAKYCLRLPPPSMNDNMSDLSRLLRGLKEDFRLNNMTVDFDVVKKLPGVLREKGWQVTVTTLVTAIEAKPSATRRPRLVNIEAGDTRHTHYSLAVDIGTTTVKGQLLDLNRGKVVAESAEYNGQRPYGADVITRITYCQKPGGLEKLQAAVVETINSILDKMLERAKVNRNDIGHLSVAGNTTMIQIFLGIDPKYIRLSPYTPVATYLPPVKAATLGVKVADYVYLSAFPLVASYIGGDITAGVVAAGVHQTKKLTYYIDIGTNGQIVIGNQDWMVTAACSAGPAFEGGEIRNGMIAANGAIEGCDIDSKTLEPTIGVIGNEKPKGICGSGLINAVAELLEKGIIGRDGHFDANLRSRRVRHGEDGYEYVLAYADGTQTGRDIAVTEIDIDNLMRAKAAMYAGFRTLVKSVGLAPEDIEQIIIAGAFGSYINVDRAVMIGLLPDLPRDRFIFIGNGSLMGARLADFSTDIIDEVRRTAKSMTNFELSENVDFMNNYVAALFLPHTNCAEFATVCERLPAATTGRG
jgi:uncharacterized 2Fe-2S/4Fe-4S cluster protein (DUF4445 family)